MVNPVLKFLRRHWRQRFAPYPPARVMPSNGYAHTRYAIMTFARGSEGPSYHECLAEERAWARGATERWRAGERM